MAKEKGMGKGLSALLGEDFSADFSTPSSTLPISQIESYQNQPRKNFNQEKLEELAESIRQHGVIQPLTVRKLASGYYQIIAGERRWRAARMAGLDEVPAVVIEADDQKAMELAMIENLDAAGVMDEFSFTAEEQQALQDSATDETLNDYMELALYILYEQGEIKGLRGLPSGTGLEALGAVFRAALKMAQVKLEALLGKISWESALKALNTIADQSD